MASEIREMPSRGPLRLLLIQADNSEEYVGLLQRSHQKGWELAYQRQPLPEDAGHCAAWLTK